MRVAVVTHNLVPYPTGFGSAIHVWSLIEVLLRRNHEVHLVCYAFNPDEGKAEWRSGDYRQTFHELNSYGLVIHLVTPPDDLGAMDPWPAMLRKALRPGPSDFYAGPRYRRQLSAVLDQISPDAVCAWTVDAVEGTPDLTCTRLGFLTDLDHLARRHRRRWRPIKGFRDRIYRLADALADHELPEIIARSLAKCQIVIDHAANHCEWLRTHGVPQAKYLPVPVLDRVGPTWRTERDDALATNKCQKVSLIGNVTGAATLPGLYLLAREIIPELKKRREWGRTEVHIIGGGKLPADLLSAFNHPWIKIRGYVDDIRAEFQSSDVFLVPTPIELGFRTRIAEAFSFGACVVAHKANSAGMPELSDGKNALLSESGSGLAGAIVRCLQEPQLRRRLEDAGRETFEQSLDGTKVCNGMIDLLEEAVRTHAE